CYNLVAMFDLFRLWLGAVLRGLRTRRSLMLENLALRQQPAAFQTPATVAKTEVVVGSHPGRQVLN
ncbi:MAG: hypothetical protein ACLPYM_03360, partial [Limisphaerales bacterium]